MLIGYGQVNHRDEIDPGTRSVEPMDLMVAAAERAADATVIGAVDSVRVVNILSAQVATTRDRVAWSSFSFEMADPSHLGAVLAAVRRIEGVYDARRVTGGKRF